MRVAFIGTRGVPARYGGFETAAEEIGARLVERGHEVLVYCRGGDTAVLVHRGMTLVHLPAVRRRIVETLSHSAVSMLHQVLRPADAAIVFNAANAPLLPLLRGRGIPAAVHVDGLEWQRGKWGPTGKRYYRAAERQAVRHADALVADAKGIQEYYEREHRAATWLLSYGAPDTAGLGTDRLGEAGLAPDGYHLVVARVEPENNVHLIIEGYLRSPARLPLVVVGGASYSLTYWQTLQTLAAQDDRVRLVGPVWDQAVLDQMYVHARTYLHGHSVGGTNPSLLRAAGAAAPVIAFDVTFNREVLQDDGRYFATAEAVAEAVAEAECDPEATHERGRRGRESVLRRYSWDQVAAGYEQLCAALVAGDGRRPPAQLYDGRYRPAATEGSRR